LGTIKKFVEVPGDACYYICMTCGICSNTIEPERLAILPNTPFCSSCARQVKTPERKARMVYSHKTGAEIQIVPAALFAATQKYFVPEGGRSCVKNFSKNITA